MTKNFDDYDGILEAVQAYIDGWNDGGNVARFARAFHPDAWIFYIDEDAIVHKWHLDDAAFAEWANAGLQVDKRILSVQQNGQAANASIVWGEDYFDFLNLLKIDGEWKITNKTASHKSR